MPTTGKIQMQERYDRIEDMLESGVPRRVIQRLLASAPKVVEGKNVGGYGVSERMVRKYLDHVDREWATQSIEDAPKRRIRIRRMTERLFAKANASGKLSVAIQILDRLARFEGMYQDRVEVTGAGGMPFAVTLGRLSDDELEFYERVNAKLLKDSGHGRPQVGDGGDPGRESPPDGLE